MAGMERFTSTIERSAPLEQWRAQAQEALAERYERYGAKREDFISFEYTDENKKTWHVVAYAGEESIHLGSWGDIQADTEGHTVLIDGVKYDDRGMTKDVYLYLLKEVMKSKTMDHENSTLLTGERQDGKFVPIASEGSRYGGSSGQAFAHSKLDFLGMRPVIFLEDLP